MNLLVICADTFRADHLGCYGNTWIETPHIDQLAREGVRFSDFYGEGLPTLPARRVFYTGRTIFPLEYHPQKGDFGNMPGWHPLFEEDVTMAECLSENGYTTGLISDIVHMMKPGKNFQRGFHSWQWIRGQEADTLVPTPHADCDLSRYLLKDDPPDPVFRRIVCQYLNNRAGWKTEADHYAAQVMRAAATWITDYGHKKPWLLWVESFDPHEPWDAPAEFVAKYSPAYEGPEPIWALPFSRDYSAAELARLKAHYAGECSHVDKWAGHVMETLKTLGMLDDTIVVFTSDHGTMLGEQGQIHKGLDRLRIQVTRCPLIIRHPDQAHAGKVIEGFVQHQDLMPTLLKLLGQPVPERCNGEDFWPLVSGERQGGLRDFVISSFCWYASVRTAEWNYQNAWFTPTFGKVCPPQLYHRPSDPEELSDVIDQHPDVARELQGRLDAALEGHDMTLSQVGETEAPAALPGVKW